MLGLSEHHDFLNGRSQNEGIGRPCYTHKRLHAVYNSLRRRLPWLFTYKSHPDLGIPNTTNPLEGRGRFANMRQHLRCHQELIKANKLRFIKDFFAEK